MRASARCVTDTDASSRSCPRGGTAGYGGPVTSGSACVTPCSRGTRLRRGHRGRRRPGAGPAPVVEGDGVRRGGTRHRRERLQDRDPPPAAERHGGDHDVPAVHRLVLGDDPDGARLPRLRAAAGIAVAQAALESAWGNSRLARDANNYFGIKARNGEDNGNDNKGGTPATVTPTPSCFDLRCCASAPLAEAQSSQPKRNRLSIRSARFARFRMKQAKLPPAPTSFR